MDLLIIVVNREEHFEKVLSILVESGVSGATIFDTEGLGHFLAYEVPIFAGLRKFVGGRKSANKTIMTLLDNKETFLRFKKLLTEENIDFTKPGIGIMMTIPVSEVIKAKDEPE